MVKDSKFNIGDLHQEALSITSVLCAHGQFLFKLTCTTNIHILEKYSLALLPFSRSHGASQFYHYKLKKERKKTMKHGIPGIG